MLNLSKFCWCILIFFAQVATVRAGEAFVFGSTNLIGFSDGVNIFGVYDAENEKFSCSFLFFGGEADSSMIDDYKDTKVLTFVPGEESLKFTDRSKFFDIPANLYRSGDEWVIRTKRSQAGCENAAGTFIFDIDDDRTEHYVVTNKIPAIGIRLVMNKSNLYDYENGRFVRRKGYLVNRNVVVSLRQIGLFSFVRFINPRIDTKNAGQVTTGWVRTENLVNPFPEAVESR
ncbi:hypothetical protein BLA50215_01404 [Burkholderia lata]|nr:hypothetical protein BLA50215_01404 [Burkholderia lata]